MRFDLLFFLPSVRAKKLSAQKGSAERERKKNYRGEKISKTRTYVQAVNYMTA